MYLIQYTTQQCLSMHVVYPICTYTVTIARIQQVLIYDKSGSDIISPLLTVKELRSLGVTLHL